MLYQNKGENLSATQKDNCSGTEWTGHSDGLKVGKQKTTGFHPADSVPDHAVPSASRRFSVQLPSDLWCPDCIPGLHAGR